MPATPSQSWLTGLLEEYVKRSNDIILITECAPLDAPDGPKIVFANAALERITGYAVDEVIGQTPRMFQGPETQRHELARIRKALEGREPVRSEIINYTKQGQPIWLDIDIAPVSACNGTITHFLAIQRDISERKKARRERERADERFHLITGATRDVVWDWDVAANTSWRSENYSRQYGYRAGNSVADRKDWSDYIESEDRERVLKSLADFLTSEESLWSEEYRFRDFGGGLHWISDRAMAERSRDGRAHRVVGIMADITEARVLEERLNRAERLESLGQLTGGIAHDFNNLLTVIMGNSERLSEKLPAGPLKEMADLSLAASESGSQLVKRLLAFARRQSLVPEAVDLNERLEEIAVLIRHRLPDSVSLNIVPSPGTRAAKVDVAQFDSAMLNLCLNARDAMPDGGDIVIELHNVDLDETYTERDSELRPGPYVMITVTDTGSGMNAETVVRAFEPFYTTKAQGAGTGLGLSMVYGFVKQSGGQVTIYSEPGVGTSVKMYFPTAATLPEELQTPVTLPEISLPLLKVLVVEDNMFVLAHARRLLNDLGLKTLDVSTAAEALEVLGKTPDISLLFTDIILPGGKDGVELAAEANRLRPDLPVLFTTGYTTNSIMIQERLDSSVSILMKPYRRADLVEKILEAIENHDAG